MDHRELWHSPERGWSQREDATYYKEMARRCLDFPSLPILQGLRRAVIYNCSDGPSSLGLSQVILRHSTDVQLVLTDIEGSAAQQCRDFVQTCCPGIDCQHLAIPSEELHAGVIQAVDLFISFEPVGDFNRFFPAMMTSLNMGGSIALCGRGPLSMGISNLREYAREQGLPLEAEFGEYYLNARPQVCWVTKQG